MKFCEQSNEPDARSILVDIHFCLGNIASETNAHSTSRKHKEIALELQLQTCKALDVVDLRLARCHSELGVALIVDGDYDAAVSALLESLSIDEQLGVYTYNWVAQVNLGLAYVLQGKLVEADKLLMAVQDRRETIFGKEDTESYRLAVKLTTQLKRTEKSL
jgi:tetratricopeptide (TPR) repeat protein